MKLFPLPKDFADANLNTLTFDKTGILWFTGQSGVYGRLDPKTGKVEAWASPRGAGTYGITTTPAGEVWYASLASDHIAHIDTATHAVTVVDPPRKGAGPRRIWSDSKGMLWTSFWNGGGIGRYDPMKKSWTTFLMPKSRNGTYAVYVDDKDRVWATDWPANAIQRFDPATEAFTTFPSDKRGAEIREIQGRPGERGAASRATTAWWWCAIDLTENRTPDGPSGGRESRPAQRGASGGTGATLSRKPVRLLRRQRRIIDVAFGLARIERGLIRRIERRLPGVAQRQIRIGQERHPEGDQVGGATRDRGVGRMRVIAAVENERALEALAQDRPGQVVPAGGAIGPATPSVTCR